MPQVFWIAYKHTNIPEPANPPYHLQIELPDNCPACGLKIEVVDAGTHNFAGYLSSTCEHIGTYYKLWEMRIQTATPQAHVPQQCKECGTLNEYAVPNTADGKYICYNCR